MGDFPYDPDEGDAGQPADYSALDGLISRARSQSDPVKWIRENVHKALKRLDEIDKPPEVKEEAKRQLFAIEQQLTRSMRRRSASTGILVALTYALVLGLPFV